MKKIFLGLISLIFISGCSKNPPPQTQMTEWIVTHDTSQIQEFYNNYQARYKGEKKEIKTLDDWDRAYIFLVDNIVNENNSKLISFIAATFVYNDRKIIWKNEKILNTLANKKIRNIGPILSVFSDNEWGPFLKMISPEKMWEILDNPSIHWSGGLLQKYSDYIETNKDFILTYICYKSFNKNNNYLPTNNKDLEKFYSKTYLYPKNGYLASKIKKYKSINNCE